jgi:rhamnogalacturonyl hydrolase YesR
MRFSCRDQLQNGAWYYGKEKKYHWIDSFHTGYNLDSLKRYIDATGDKQFSRHLKKGYDFFKSHFLGEGGCPWYYFDRKYPLDIQCASQIIDTLTFFSAMDQGALKLALDVAGWTVANMQEKDGHFIYRLYPAGFKAKAAMIHWGQATMFRAMAHLLSRVGEAAGA